MFKNTPLLRVIRTLAPLIFSLGLIANATAAQAQSPTGVSALIYSRTALELFWTPTAGQLVEVSRNGTVLGQYDARSLFQAGLTRDAQYNYTLRSIDRSGNRSEPVILSVNTQHFSVPNKRVMPVTAASAQTTPALEGVSALIYSRTALELFWTATPGELVEVSRNGTVLGQYDARSLFQTGLTRGEQYNYTLRSIDSTGNRSEPVILSLNTQHFSVPIKRVMPVTAAESDDQIESPAPPPPPPIAQVTAEPVVEKVVQTDNNCIASDTNTLLSCVRNASSYRRVDLANDITCENNCCPDGGALLKLNGVQNLEIAGNGHRLLRTSGQRQCSLLDITRGSSIKVNNIRLDDDQRVGGCQVDENCPRMVNIESANNVSFDQAHISHGKGYAFYVQSTNGFTFDNSSLTNSGVLGMYVGHAGESSSNIRITNSIFRDNQTNGLALLGVHGQSISSNLIADNLFIRNHRLGQWAVEPRFGSGFTGGGQFYIAQADNVTVRDNILKDGYCDNCYIQNIFRSGVTGIELGLPNRASVKNLDVSGNKVFNHDGFGILQNPNSALSNVRITNNQLLNNSRADNVNGAQKLANRVINTQRFDSFESSNDIGGLFNTSVSCSSGGSVIRQCGEGSVHGQCAAQLRLASADCEDVKAELLGPRVNVSSGQSVVADGWVKSPRGTWCIVFRDSSGNQLNEQCKNIANADRSAVQSFVGLPSIDTRAPSGSNSAQLRITHSITNFTMLVDDLMLSVGD